MHLRVFPIPAPNSRFSPPCSAVVRLGIFIVLLHLFAATLAAVDVAIAAAVVADAVVPCCVATASVVCCCWLSLSSLFLAIAFQRAIDRLMIAGVAVVGVGGVLVVVLPILSPWHFHRLVEKIKNAKTEDGGIEPSTVTHWLSNYKPYIIKTGHCYTGHMCWLQCAARSEQRRQKSETALVLGDAWTTQARAR